MFCVLVETAQIFGKVPFREHEIALRAPRIKYKVIYWEKQTIIKFLVISANKIEELEKIVQSWRSAAKDN